jgi:hypothetical protein
VISFTLTGQEKLATNLRAMPLELRRPRVLEVLEVAGEPMRHRMGILAPRGPDSPHLADSMKIQALTKIDGVKLNEHQVAVAIGPSKDFFYGLFWEFGWARHPSPHPFARPSFDECAQPALVEIGRGLWGIIAPAASTSGRSL